MDKCIVTISEEGKLLTSAHMVVFIRNNNDMGHLQVYSAADYSALLINRNLLPIEELVHPTTLIEKQCSVLYDQLKAKDIIPSSVYDVPKDIADNASALDALTRITDLVVTFNESTEYLFWFVIYRKFKLLITRLYCNFVDRRFIDSKQFGEFGMYPQN